MGIVTRCIVQNKIPVLGPVLLRGYFNRLGRLRVGEFEDAVKRFTIRLRDYDNHSVYNGLLSFFVSKYVAKYESAVFMGKGVGDGSLNTYRKLRLKSGEDVFEKVYFTESEAFTRTHQFYDLVFSSLSQYLVLPKLTASYEGAKMSVCHFEFKNLEIIDSSVLIAELISVVKSLIECSAHIERANDLSFRSELKSVYKYRVQLGRAKELFRRHGISHDDLLEKVMGSQKVITHCDLGHKNVFRNRTVVDWDYFGFYPIGLDYAIIFYYYLLEKNEIDPIVWLRSSAKDLRCGVDWDGLERNFLYYLIVISINLLDNMAGKSIQENLLSKVKKYCY